MYFNIYKVLENNFHIDRDTYDNKVKETTRYGSRNESIISEYNTYDGTVKNSRFLTEKQYYIPNNTVYEILDKYFGSVFETKVIVNENSNLLYLFKNYFIRKFREYCSVSTSGYNYTNWVFTDLDTYVSKSIKNDTSFFNEKNMLDYDLVILHYPVSTQNNILNADKIFSLSKKRALHNLPTILLLEDSRISVNKNNPKVNILDKLKGTYKSTQIHTFDNINYDLKTKFLNYLVNSIELDKLLSEEYDSFIESFISYKKNENVLLYNYSQLDDPNKNLYKKVLVNQLKDIQNNKKIVLSNIDSIRTLSNEIKVNLQSLDLELRTLLDKYAVSNKYSLENYFKKLSTTTVKKEIEQQVKPVVNFSNNIDDVIKDLENDELVINPVNDLELNLSMKTKSKKSNYKIKSKETNNILNLLNNPVD